VESPLLRQGFGGVRRRGLGTESELPARLKNLISLQKKNKLSKGWVNIVTHGKPVFFRINHFLTFI